MLREHGTNQTRAPAENDNTGPNVLWAASPLCTVSVGTRSPTTPQTRCTQCIQRRRLRAPRKTLSLMSGTLTNACSRCAFISLGHSSRCLFVPSPRAAPRHTGALVHWCTPELTAKTRTTHTGPSVVTGVENCIVRPPDASRLCRHTHRRQHSHANCVTGRQSFALCGAKHARWCAACLSLANSRKWVRE